MSEDTYSGAKIFFITEENSPVQSLRNFIADAIRADRAKVIEKLQRSIHDDKYADEFIEGIDVGYKNAIGYLEKLPIGDEK